MKAFPDPPVQSADWTGYASKVEWLSQAVPKLQGHGWLWIDDDVRNYAKEIEELKLPKERCIQVSPKGEGVLTEVREELTETLRSLEKLKHEQVV